MITLLARIIVCAVLAPLFASISLLAAADAKPATLDPSVAKQIDAVFVQWDNTRSPGAVIAVSRHGMVIFTRGYGMSNLETDIPLSPDSIFHVASISKQFTAACVQLLAAEGKLSWTDDIRRYVPELPDYGQKITLAHLAHHSSGLRDQWSLLRMAGWRDDDLITEDDILRIASRQKSLNFVPGEEYVYCNTGYTLLAIVVKRVAGLSLREFADERIFKPLGMHATHFHSDHTEVVRGRTSAYEPRLAGGYKISIPVFDTYGATSLFTTVADLLKWEQNFIEPQVGGRALVDALIASGQLNRGIATGYGLGVISGRPRGLLEVGHGGADAGYRSDVVQFPEHGLAVAVFCNLSSMRPALLSRKVAEIILGDAFTPLPAAVTIEEGELKRLPGTYYNEATGELRHFSVRDGKLMQTGAVDPWVPLGGGRFRAGETSSEIAFPTLAVGGAASAGPVEELCILSPTLGRSTLKRLKSHAPSREELAALTGEFTSEELLGARFHLSVNQEAKLECRPPRGERFVLTPITRDIFTGQFGLVRFDRNAAGDVIGLTFSGVRVRRLFLLKVAALR